MVGSPIEWLKPPVASTAMPATPADVRRNARRCAESRSSGPGAAGRAALLRRAFDRGTPGGRRHRRNRERGQQDQRGMDRRQQRVRPGGVLAHGCPFVLVERTRLE